MCIEEITRIEWKLTSKIKGRIKVTLTNSDTAATMIKAAAYQWSIIQRRNVARLSSDKRSFLKVAKGPLGSTCRTVRR